LRNSCLGCMVDAENIVGWSAILISPKFSHKKSREDITSAVLKRVFHQRCCRQLLGACDAGISQRDVTQRFEFLLAEKKAVQEAILKFHHQNVARQFPLENCALPYEIVLVLRSPRLCHKLRSSFTEQDMRPICCEGSCTVHGMYWCNYSTLNHV
jgi:hypothetical protein